MRTKIEDNDKEKMTDGVEDDRHLPRSETLPGSSLRSAMCVSTRSQCLRSRSHGSKATSTSTCTTEVVPRDLTRVSVRVDRDANGYHWGTDSEQLR